MQLDNVKQWRVVTERRKLESNPSTEHTMFIRFGLFRHFPVSPGPCAALLVSSFLLLPGTLSAAEHEDTELPFGESERVEAEPYADRIESHASGAANKELMRTAGRSPEQFIGKKVVLEDGRKIGTVLDIQRSLRDNQLYLILDATEFFNNPTEYAVPAQDMRRLQDDTLIIAEYTGMHLRGLEYYEEDYVGIGDKTPED